MMTLWNVKSCSYRLVSAGVVFGFVQFVIGFGLPAWKKDGEFMSGLWQNCTILLTQCQFYSTQKADGKLYINVLLNKCHVQSCNFNIKFCSCYLEIETSVLQPSMA